MVAAGEEDHHVLGGTAIRPKKRKGFDKVSHFLRDKDAGTFCSRTPKSWLLITGFYIIYYSCLAGFWYGLLNIFVLTLDPDGGPRYQTSASIIGTQPGVGVRPSQTENHIQSSLYFLGLDYDGTSKSDDPSRAEGNVGYASRLQEFFKTYEDNAKGNSNATDCSGDKPGQAQKGKFCKFDTGLLGDCKDFPYGYNAEEGSLSPCVYVKLNRIFGLTPEPMDSEEDFPEGTDEAFKERIVNEKFPKKLFIDCQGEFPADKEALSGKIRYFPSDQSISLKYFPITTTAANESPIVAMKFDKLPVGQLVHVICKTYFKGVVHSKKEKRGLVQFQILVQEDKE